MYKNLTIVVLLFTRKKNDSKECMFFPTHKYITVKDREKYYYRDKK